MIKLQNPLGKIYLTGNFFAELVSNAAQNCYGVADMAPCGPADLARSLLPDIAPEKGVRVIRENGELCIELHIKVTYGVNIGAIVRSIIHKVKYAVEDATGLQVQRISVSVDDIVY
ncbi:MAG: Asp23/Gls24 family envelope stress response protein [Oscillospiraceae bacterium]|nr:Asp23/Gls24 family envelope stress response protein [Oscillospiraceae bacterium]